MKPRCVCWQRDNLQVWIFLQGLTPQSLRAACLTNGPRMLHKAIDMATRLEPLMGFTNYPLHCKNDKPQARGTKPASKMQKPSNRTENKSTRNGVPAMLKPCTSTPAASSCTGGARC